MFNVEIIYAEAHKIFRFEVKVSAQNTVKEVLLNSKILEAFPHWDLNLIQVGVFGKKISLDSFIHKSERLEIYRPLIIDPKMARKNRAKAGKNGTSS